MKEQLLNMVGQFTWSFGKEFFIETELGNFVWNDPHYGGDNTITQFNGSYADWLTFENIPFGRDKGAKLISSYCGYYWTFSG